MVQLRTVIFALIFLSGTSFAATPGVNNVWQVGGAPNGTAASVIAPFNGNTFELTATQLTAFGGGNYLGFYKAGAGGNAQYEVPVTKTAAICSGMYYASNANAQVSLGAADGTTTDGGAAPTGFFPYEKTGGEALTIKTSSTDFYWMPGYWQFQAGKYPTLYMGTSTVNATYRLVCQEQ